MNDKLKNWEQIPEEPSLLVSTLDEIFRGNRELFKGLWIDSTDYQWQSYPVIRIDFSLMPIKDAETLKKSLKRLIRRIARQNQVIIEDGEYYELFEDLIFELRSTTKRSSI